MAHDFEVSNMQKTPQQQAEYDAWFRKQVEDGLREADDPNTVWVSNDEVFSTLDETLRQWHERTAHKKAS